MNRYHIPVLLHPSVDLLQIKPGGVYVDATFGGGGHSREILTRIEKGLLVAFDQDKDAAANQWEDARFRFVRQNFRHMVQALEKIQITQVDGILADLGISSHQIDQPERGFSFRFDARLDMRMDQRQELTAADVLNETPEEELVRVFSRYGEIPNAKKLVRLISEYRTHDKLTYTQQLETVIESCIPRDRRSKYLAQVYQALRIQVNGELQALEALLLNSLQLLKPGGRMVVISYHSLEDRLVKRFFRSGNFQGELIKDFYGNPLTPWKVLTRKAIQPTPEEIEANARARSARLRAVERMEKPM